MPYTNNDGVHIYFEVAGTGPALVLQHGLSDSISTWRESGLAERLQPHHRLIMLDARGHGLSDKPHDPAAYELKLRVGDVLAVLDALDLGQADFYGYSMGGWIGYGMALYAPERLGRLIVGGAHPYGGSMAFFRQIFADDMLAWLQLLEKMAGPVPFHTRERLLSNDITALQASIADDRADLAAQLVAAQVPLRLLAGTADQEFPRIVRFAQEFGTTQLFPLGELNHFQAHLRSDLVAPIILDQRPGTSGARL